MHDCIEFVLFVLLVDFIWLKFFKTKLTYDRCDSFKVGALIALICFFLYDIFIKRKFEKYGMRDVAFGIAVVISSKYLIN
jgi:hypothetical protein